MLQLVLILHLNKRSFPIYNGNFQICIRSIITTKVFQFKNESITRKSLNNEPLKITNFKVKNMDSSIILDPLSRILLWIAHATRPLNCKYVYRPFKLNHLVQKYKIISRGHFLFLEHNAINLLVNHSVFNRELSKNCNTPPSPPLCSA